MKNISSYTAAKVFLAALLFIFVAGFYSPSFAHSHHNSLIKWEEYSQKVFEEAAEKQKPIFLYITAIWCYWCKVFEETVLETKEVSDYLNERYINIYVDYDKRKDIAGKYNPTGLPYILIFSPEGEELVGVGGFIEKAKFIESLKRTVEYLKTEYKPMVADDAEVRKPTGDILYPDKEDLAKIAEGMETILKSNYDNRYGGFGSSEKKPHGDALLYMMELYRDTGEGSWMKMVQETLDYIGGIKRDKKKTSKKPDPSYIISLYRNKDDKDWIDKVGRIQEEDIIYGLYDDVEGGFFRYTLLRNWSMPHFEKMLSENAEIIRAYLKAYELTKRPEYKERALGGIKYVMNNLYDKKGYFYGSQAANALYYHLGADDRKKVEPPYVDTTGYSVSNAKMILTLLDARKVLGEEKYLETVKKAVKFILKNNLGQRGVFSYFDHEKEIGELDGQLSDNTWVALALLEGYKVTKDEKLLKAAKKIMDFMFSELYDFSKGGFYERKSTRKEIYREGEVLSYNKPYVENGVAAYTLLVAYEITGKEKYLSKAKETIGSLINEYPDASKPYFQRAARELVRISKKTGGKRK